MTITFQAVTQENMPEVLALQVKKQQVDFIETTAQCLNEAASLALWRPVGIYDQADLIGFAMYGFFPSEESDGRLWLDRLLIDARFQGKGYGRASLLAILEKLRQEYAIEEIYLSVYDNNPVAIQLYQSIGFMFNGELDFGGEKIMVLQA